MTNRSKAFFSLIGAAVVFAILPSIPFGNVAQWPFEMLTTYVHELGHGLAALAQGGSFLKLEIFPSGGGVATVVNAPQPWGRALTSAGGLLAPSIAGGLFILAARSRKTASVIFVGFALLMLVSCVLWIRSTFALALVGGMGLAFLYLGVKSSMGVHQFMIQFFAVHMLVDTLTRTMRYLFTNTFTRDGQIRHSDTANIADSLGGSYWVWGVLIAITALAIFYLCFRRAYLR